MLDVDFVEGDVVGGEEALGFAAVAAPGGRVDGDIHRVLFYPVARWSAGGLLYNPAYVAAQGANAGASWRGQIITMLRGFGVQR